MRTLVINAFPDITPEDQMKHCRTPFCDCNPEVDIQMFRRIDAQIYEVTHKPLPTVETVYDEVVINTDLEAVAV